MKAKPIPDGFHTVTPYLHVQEVPRLIEFLKRAFGAKEVGVSKMPDGTILNARLRIGDSMIELSEARGDFKQMPCAIHLYLDDVDATYRQAIQAGGTSVMEPTDQSYGDRDAFVRDPAGNHWYIAKHIKD